MNAQGVKNKEHLNRLLCRTNYAVQEKLNGMRAIIHICNAGLRIFSKSGGVSDPTRPLEKTSSLSHLANLKYQLLVGTILDAEILAPGIERASMTGAIHSNQVSSTNGQVVAYIFDVLRYCGEDLSSRVLHQRIGILETLKTRIHSPYLIFLPWAFSADDKRKLYNDVMKRGGEGIMLKRLDAIYLYGGKPANNWIKAKKSATFDCIIMGFTKGKGSYNNQIGAVKFGQYIGKHLVELGRASGMTRAIRIDMSVNPNRYIGQVVVIKGLERLKSGAIENPQFGGMRSDKLPKDCIWYRGEQ